MAITNPSDITTLELWIDHNSSGLPSTDGAEVTGWNDQSANTRHLSTTAGNGPTWDDTDTAVSFGSSDYLDDGGQGGANWSSYTLAFCIKRIGSPSSGIMFASGNATPEISAHSAYAPGGDFNAFRLYYPEGEAYGSAAPSTSAFEVWYITHNVSTNTVEFYKNNVLDRSTTLSESSTLTDTLFRIGWSNGTTQAMKLRGLCLYKKVFSSTERTDFYNWANNNWLNTTPASGEISPSKIASTTVVRQPGLNAPAPGGGGGTAPDEISNLEWWVDARDFSGFSSDTAVANWDDRSSYDRDGTEGSTIQQPIYRASDEAVEFDGSDDGLITTTGASLFTDFTIAMAIRRKTPTKAQTVLAETNWGWFLKFNSDGTFRFQGSGDLVDCTQAVSSSVWDLWYIVAKATTDTVAFYKNNVLVNSGTLSGLVSVGDAGIRLGNNGGCDYFQVKTVCIWKKELTSQERADLYTYGQVAWLGYEPQSAPISPSKLTTKTLVRQPTLSVGGVINADSPDDLSGLTLWLDYRDLTGNSDGANITSWNDRSPVGRDVSANTSANYPTWDKVNNAVAFRSPDDSLQTTVDGSTSSYHTFAIVARRTSTRAGGLIASEITSKHYLYYEGTGQWVAVNSSSVMRSNGQLSSDDFDLWIFTINQVDGVMEVWFNGLLDASATDILNDSPVIDSGWMLGSPTQAENFDIRAFLVYNRVLTQSEIDLLYSYGSANWIGAGQGGEQFISFLTPGSGTGGGDSLPYPPTNVSQVFFPTLTTTDVNGVTQSETAPSTRVRRPVVTGGSVAPADVSAHSTSLGSSLFGPHDRIVYPLVITEINNTITFYDSSTGGSRYVRPDDGVYYAHLDAAVDADFPSIYFEILEKIHEVSSNTYHFEVYNIADSEFEASGLRLVCDSGSNTFGMVFLEPWLDHRILGADSATGHEVTGTQLDFPCDYGGVFRSPHRASDKRRVKTARDISLSGEEPEGFSIGWEIGERRVFRYHHLHAAHVYEHRSKDSTLAAQAGLALGGYNALETFFNSPGHALVVHDTGDVDANISTGGHQFEVVQLSDIKQVESFDDIIESVPAGEVYDVEFEVFLINDHSDSGYSF